MKTNDGLWKLNPSSLYGYEACPACFWLEQHFGRKPMIPFRLNDAVDEKLKNRYDHFRKLGHLPTEISDKLKGYKLFPDQEVLDGWRNWRKGLIYVNKKLGLVLSGALDEVLINPAGKLVPAGRNILMMTPYSCRHHPVRGNPCCRALIWPLSLTARGGLGPAVKSLQAIAICRK